MKTGLIILPYLHMGGAETQFRLLIEGLKNDYDLKVYIMAPFDKNDEYILRNPEIKFKKIGFLFLNSYNKKILKVFSYFFNYFIISIILLLDLVRKKRRYDFLITYQEILSPFILVSLIISKKVLFSIRSASRKLLKRKYLKYLFNKCDLIISNSYEGEEYLKKIGVKKTIVILNGICKSKKYIEEVQISENIKKIFIIARIHPLKNQKIVLEAFKELNVELNFIGQITDKKYKIELDEYIKKNKMENKVIFFSYQNDMEKVWKNSDLVILPSLEEGVANVILESYYNKKLILCSNIKENLFLIKNEKRLFNPFNAEELKIKFLNLIEEDRSSLEKELKENYNFIEKEFSLKKMIENYKQVIEMVPLVKNRN